MMPHPMEDPAGMSRMPSSPKGGVASALPPGAPGAGEEGGDVSQQQQQVGIAGCSQQGGREESPPSFSVCDG